MNFKLTQTGIINLFNWEKKIQIILNISMFVIILVDIYRGDLIMCK